ncbi:MAG: NADH-quinone oxidoreductase subunit N, partial [Polyangiales bacterium]
AVRYFLLGAFAAAVWLFGAALLYGATGSTRLVDIGQHIRSGAADLPLAAAAMALLVAGLAFKLAAVPLHTWAADAYQGAITPVTLFMAVVVKSAAMLALLRLLLLAFGMDDARQGQGGWASLLAGLSALSMVVGNLAALGQRNLKRMLAYSSIAHAGYLLLGAVAAAHGQHQAVAAVLYYLAAYAFSSLLAFGGLMLLGSRGKEAVDLDDVRGAGRVHPLLALPLTLGALSLLGFPPTAGFVGKYLVFVAAVQADAALWPLLGLGLLSSLVGAAYYLRVVMVLFSDPQSSDGRCLAQPMVARGMYVALGVAVYALLHLGLLPASLLDWSLRAAQALG